MAGSAIIYERFTWFHRQVKAGLYPNTRHLAEHFEISRRTAKRHIEFMRDRLGAPLKYDHSRCGYAYDCNAFDFPLLPVSQEEVLAVLIARKLLSHSAEGFISKTMRRLGRKILDQTAELGWNSEHLDRLFSSTWHGFTRTSANTFQVVTRALLENRLIEFAYHSPLSEAPTSRMVEPHHLQHYMASWVLIAWCRLRNQWRKFYLSRMSHLKIHNETFIPRSESQWRPMVEGTFGIFQGESASLVTLLFNAFRAKWIREQVWHPKQMIREMPDGGVELSFKVADFREVKMKILEFGADVEVIEPTALRREVADEIRKMSRMYER